jgi:putative hemolysin
MICPIPTKELRNYLEILILVLLLVVNGVFAMSEMAIVSSRKAYLQERLDKGEKGAKEALELLNEPNRFLSTVQVGITLVGIIAGAFGGSAIADDVAGAVRQYVPALSPYASEIGFGLIVTLITYLSLVIGELVPKRIALNNPERVAVLLAPPMGQLSRIAAPLVWLLSKSTELLSSLLGVKGEGNQFITDFEVLALMREGMDSGEFKLHEHEMVKGALELDDIRVREIITPRINMVWLDVKDSRESLIQKLRDSNFSMYPVGDGEIEDTLGVVFSQDLLLQLLIEEQPNLLKLIHEPLYVPETAIAADVLQQFKTKVVTMALVVSEHGSIEGMVTQNDILQEIVGDLELVDDKPVQREDGSWLVSGQYPISDLEELLENFTIPSAEFGDYNTIAGFILARLGHIPNISASFGWGNYRLEVVDMDGRRIDKVLISRKSNDS